MFAFGTTILLNIKRNVCRARVGVLFIPRFGKTRRVFRRHNTRAVKKPLSLEGTLRMRSHRVLDDPKRMELWKKNCLCERVLSR